MGAIWATTGLAGVANTIVIGIVNPVALFVISSVNCILTPVFAGTLWQ